MQPRPGIPGTPKNRVVPDPPSEPSAGVGRNGVGTPVLYRVIRRVAVNPRGALPLLFWLLPGACRTFAGRGAGHLKASLTGGQAD